MWALTREVIILFDHAYCYLKMPVEMTFFKQKLLSKVVSFETIWILNMYQHRVILSYLKGYLM